jgi:hypothetical protein
MTIAAPPREDNNGVPPPSRRIRFAAIREAWEFAKAERMTWTLITLVHMLVYVSLYYLVPKLLTLLVVPALAKSHNP